LYIRFKMNAVLSATDLELFALIREGDRIAFTALYNRYWDKLLALAYNHTRDKQSAEEVVQNLFIGLWNRKETLTIDNPANYLATAVKFAVFKEYYRKQKREASLIGKLTIAQEHQIEEQISAKFLQEYINGIVETLPEKCRLVFKLSRESHMSNIEIGEEMGIAEKTVEAHLTKALKTIRTELNSSGVMIVIATGINYLIK
jgi:RNA polymerase sigma-70 factor (family 1)